MRRSTKPISVRSLKDLGLYSAFDVSKWCADNGIISVYLEHKREKIMDVAWAYMSQPGWVVKDARDPGKIIQKFTFRGDSTMTDIRKRGEAWVEAQYDMPMKYMAVMKASFAAPAVDLILDELELMRRIWSPDPDVKAQVPVALASKFLIEHPAPPKSLEIGNEVKMPVVG